MLASVPVSTSAPVPEPVTPTEPPAMAVSTPEATLSVTEMSPTAASTSATDRPVNWTEMSSLVVQPAGSVLTGASLTAAIVSCNVDVSAPPAPSETL